MKPIQQNRETSKTACKTDYKTAMQSATIVHQPNNLTEDHLNLLRFVISSQHTHVQPEQWQPGAPAPRGFGCILRHGKQCRAETHSTFFYCSINMKDHLESFTTSQTQITAN